MILTFVNYKGGTGKTTSCISVAGCLAKKGKDVLVIDLDPQGNATSGLGIDKNGLKFGMHHVMNKKKDIKKIILPTNTKNIIVAPADHNLARFNLTSYTRKSQAKILNKALKKIKNYHDYILIDTPPIYGHFIINGMVAADEVIAIVDPGIFALEGLSTLENYFRDYLKKLGSNLNLNTVLIVRSQDSVLPWKKKYSKEIKKDIEKNFKKKVFMIPYSEHIYETHARAIPISHYKPRSNIAKQYEKVAEQYLTFGKTPISHYKPRSNIAKQYEKVAEKYLSLLKSKKKGKGESFY